MRAFAVVVSFVLFYVLSILLALGLGYLGWRFLAALGEFRGNGVVVMGLAALAMIAAACIILWSVFPRIDRFEPPGPEIKQSEQPELFALIREVAVAVNQPVPQHVYLTLELNAFVTEGGGIMGIGSKRVMGIGVALLEGLSIDELRGVIAHEFGHFDGGDTKLGPWIYKTRSAMGRTVSNLWSMANRSREIEAFALVLAVMARPFQWAVMGYLRLAGVISRRQEFAADRVAANLVGPDAIVSAFEKLPRYGLAADVYLAQEIEPLIKAGALPPVIAGFGAFREAVATQLDLVDADSKSFGEQSPFDSHPPLPDRIAAVRALPAVAPRFSSNSANAISLLRDPDRVERSLFAKLGSLERIEWQQAGTLLLKLMRTDFAQHRFVVGGLTCKELIPSTTLGRRIARENPKVSHLADQLPDELMMNLARQVVVQGLVVALADAGHRVESTPGKPLTVHNGERNIAPATLLAHVIDGTVSADEFAAKCAEWGLAEKPFAARAK